MKPITLLNSSLLLALLLPCAARAQSVDIPRLAEVVCRLEPRGEEFPEWAISKRGAVGLCQLLVDTARTVWTRAGMTVAYHPSLLFNPDVSKRLARAYLAVCVAHGWRGAYELAFCYHNGHHARRRKSGRGHAYALEVEAEYEKAPLAMR